MMVKSAGRASLPEGPFPLEFLTGQAVPPMQLGGRFLADCPVFATKHGASISSAFYSLLRNFSKTVPDCQTVWFVPKRTP